MTIDEEKLEKFYKNLEELGLLGDPISIEINWATEDTLKPICTANVRCALQRYARRVWPSRYRRCGRASIPPYQPKEPRP